MTFKTISNLCADITHWIERDGHDYDCIVGVPRSGLLVANIMALRLDLPMSDLESFLNGRLIQSGHRMRNRDFSNYFETRRKILVVDDSIYTGRAMVEVKERLASVMHLHDITLGAVYVVTEERHLVDTYFQVLPRIRFFEWNLFTSLLKYVCFDMDGVLCQDPTEEQNDDGVRYQQFMREAKPLYLPKFELDTIVTSRLEKYRPETDAWLEAHGVKTQRLLMLDAPDKETRQRTNGALAHKLKIYKDSYYHLFVESDPVTARKLAMLSGKPVYCVGDSVYYDGSPIQSRCALLKSNFKTRLTHLLKSKAPNMFIKLKQIYLRFKKPKHSG